MIGGLRLDATPVSGCDVKPHVRPRSCRLRTARSVTQELADAADRGDAVQLRAQRPRDRRAGVEEIDVDAARAGRVPALELAMCRVFRGAQPTPQGPYRGCMSSPSSQRSRDERRVAQAPPGFQRVGEMVLPVVGPFLAERSGHVICAMTVAPPRPIRLRSASARSFSAARGLDRRHTCRRAPSPTRRMLGPASRRRRAGRIAAVATSQPRSQCGACRLAERRPGQGDGPLRRDIIDALIPPPPLRNTADITHAELLRQAD